MKSHLANLSVTAHQRKTTLFFVYVVVILLAALALAPIAEAGGSIRDF